MIQFQVPQFIETEDKVIGPLTLRQFGYIGSFAGVTALLLFILEFWLWIIIASILLGIGAGLAFGKVNGRPISIYVKALLRSIWAPNVYVFKQKDEAEEKAPTPTLKIRKVKPQAPKVEQPGIKELWQKINTTKKAIPRREAALPVQAQSFSQFKDRFEAVRQLTGEREVAKRVDYR